MSIAWQKNNPEKVAAKARKYRNAHLEICRDREREWRAANKSTRSAAARRRRANNPDKVKAESERTRFASPLYKSKWHAAKYGYAKCTATSAELRDSFTGRCFVCDVQELPGNRLHMDHDHITGRFRGWLCKRCNHALGMANDSSNRLRSLANYLDVNAQTSPVPQAS